MNLFYCRSMFHDHAKNAENSFPDPIRESLDRVISLSEEDVKRIKRKIVLYHAGKLLWREIRELVYNYCIGCQHDSLSQTAHTCVNMWSDLCLRDGWATEFFDNHIDQALVELDWSELAHAVKSSTDVIDTDNYALCQPKAWRTRAAIHDFKNSVRNDICDHATGDASYLFMCDLYEDVSRIQANPSN